MGRAYTLLLVAGVLLAGMVGSPTQEQVQRRWKQDEVDDAMAFGLIGEIAPGEFGGDLPVSRGELAKILLEARPYLRGLQGPPGPQGPAGPPGPAGQTTATGETEQYRALAREVQELRQMVMGQTGAARRGESLEDELASLKSTVEVLSVQVRGRSNYGAHSPGPSVTESISSLDGRLTRLESAARAAGDQGEQRHRAIDNELRQLRDRVAQQSSGRWHRNIETDVSSLKRDVENLRGRMRGPSGGNAPTHDPGVGHKVGSIEQSLRSLEARVSRLESKADELSRRVK